MKKLKKAQFVMLDAKRIGIIVGTELDANVPDDHVAIWFGNMENGKPEVWTVPAEYCKRAPDPVYKH